MAGRGKYMVTPAGRAWLDEQYPVLFADLRADPGADAAYAGFEEVNRELLALMTRWQTVTVGGEAVPNDHTDAELRRRRAGRAGEAATTDADPVLDVLRRAGAAARRPPAQAGRGAGAGRRRARPTTSAACGWRATTPCGSSSTKTCCGCWAARGNSEHGHRRCRRPRRQRRPGPRGDRQQGAQPGHDAPARHAGAARVRADHRGRQALRGRPARRRVGRRAGRAGPPRSGHGAQVRRGAAASPCVPARPRACPG